MLITPETLQALAAQISEVDSRCYSILNFRKNNLNGDADWFWSHAQFDGWELEGDCVQIKCVAYTQGGVDDDYLQIPLESFCAENWQDLCLQAFEQQAAKYKAAREQEERQRKLLEQDARRRKYEELRKEFGDV